VNVFLGAASNIGSWEASSSTGNYHNLVWSDGTWRPLLATYCNTLQARLQEIGGRRPKRRGPKVYEQMPADTITKLLQTTCARCHKLTYTGKVQSEVAEKELPPFDLAAAMATQIKSKWKRRAVVLLVVDIADFDGSLPRYAPPVTPLL
jgi:hypothetical protein